MGRTGEGVPGASTLQLEGPNGVMATSEDAALVQYFLDESSPYKSSLISPLLLVQIPKAGVGVST